MKIVKPQDYAKRTGCLPRAGGGGEGGGSGQGFTTSEAYTFLLGPAGILGGTLSGWRQVDLVGGSGPTPPSHGGPGACWGGYPVLPSRGRQGLPPHHGCAQLGQGPRGELPWVGGVPTHRLP